MSIEAHGNSQAMHRTGWILSGIVIAFMAADAVVLATVRYREGGRTMPEK
jgi:hypothetical protein